MEENLANRSRAELETALRDSSRVLQAMLATQLRSFDGECLPGCSGAAGCWCIGARGVAHWALPGVSMQRVGHWQEEVGELVLWG